MNRIDILNKSYEIVDEIESIAIVDSFVKVNKLKPIIVGAKPGHGEARLYVGPQSIDNDFKVFFNYFQDNSCFFLKSDFLDYLNDAEYEYKNQEQEYNKDLKPLWSENIDDTKERIEDLFLFAIEPATGTKDKARFYIRSNDDAWELFRVIALPRISYLSILKLKSKEGNIYYYFKIFLDYHFNTNNHPSKIRQEEKAIEESTSISTTKKEVIISARIGQGKFREKLLQQMFSCPITEVSDERLLMASHIKPWVKSTDKEKTDPFNGIILTPTYDRMFDQGFISFDDEGKLLISPYISPLNIKKLNIIKNKIYKIQPKGREKYLDYHRKFIFKS
ncbi:HNH endonuclease [Mucilaginibacter sp. HMF5004]|uniref:HNH endonuclease n=1 Tax=Mucilaginibacter rivuli TaxID=2857527 RepID=UPI001C5E6153|nr:HNH endonuclease [Mucilaginibacter rivuli]MBW4888255.1 HNH endonuclease [Mucilaginibacter rivuli]